MILNINKPKDWTSYDVVAKLKNTLKVKKVGHAGTLDPLAEGVLIILTGKDTQKQDEIMKSKKEYVAEIAFGATTPSYDLEFIPQVQILESITPLQLLDDVTNKLPGIITKYIGSIGQTVPQFSAKKIEGKTLYKEARKALEVAKETGGVYDQTAMAPLPTKQVQIDSIEILDIGLKSILTVRGLLDSPVAKIKVVCSSGTYIRSLANDFGNDLGCGGVLFSLVRTKVGIFKIEDSKNLAELIIQASASLDQHRNFPHTHVFQ